MTLAASTSHTQNRAAANAAAAILNNLTPQQQQLLQNAAKNGLLNTTTAHALLQQAQQVQANGELFFFLWLSIRKVNMWQLELTRLRENSMQRWISA